MSREYGKVSPQFWTGATGKALRGDPEAQLLALYLVSNPHCNMIGLYYLPLMYAAHEIGMTTEGASKALQRLIEGGFCDYDEASEVVFVREMAKWQIAAELKATDKRVKGVENELARLPKTRLLSCFYERYGAAYHLETPRGLQGPSKALRSQEQEQEQKQEQEIHSPPIPPSLEKQKVPDGERQGGGVSDRASPSGKTQRPSSHSDPYGAMFEAWWAQYPRQEAKGAAREEYLRAVRFAGVDQFELLEALDAHKQSEQWRKENGRYIPRADRWLKDERWNDELPSARDGPYDAVMDDALRYFQDPETGEDDVRCFAELQNLDPEELLQRCKSQSSKLTYAGS